LIVIVCVGVLGDTVATTNGFNGNNNNDHIIEFFRDGRDGDIQGIWSFGVNGFFIPPPDFAGLSLSTSGTIIPTSAVGLICFDGVGGCTIELTAVVGGNLGRQVFNVTMNTIRFISSICRVRVSQFGRTTIQAKFAEVSTRLMPTSALSVPITIVLQLQSRQFAFIAFDTFFVMEGQALRINRFSKFINDFQDDTASKQDNGPAGSGPSSGGPGLMSPNGMGSPLGNGNNKNNNNNQNHGFGVCPSLLDTSSSFGSGDFDNSDGNDFNNNGFGGGH